MMNFKNIIINNKWLTIILLGCFLLSLGYAFYYQIEPLVDARAYDNIAKNLISGQGYREDLGSSLDKDVSVVRAGPTYEYLLAGIYGIFGQSYPVVWILQALLHVASAFLIYLSCLLIFPNSEHKKKIALLSAAFLAFYPDLIEISAMLMTETFYIFLICLSLYFFFLYLHNNRWQTLLIFSLVFGLTILTRSPVVFLIPVVLFYFLSKKQFKRGFLFVLLIGIVLSPWAVRNYYAYGKLMPFGAGGAYNFWIGNHPGASGEQEPGLELSNFFDSHTVLESYNKSMAEFKNFVLSSPGEFLKITLMRSNKYFSILRPMGFWFYASGWRQILFVLSSAVFSFAIFVLSLAGAIWTVRFKEKSLYYILAFAIFTPLIIFISVVETRYRFQIYPLLAILAAYFVNQKQVDKKLWYQILALSVAIILANGFLDGVINLDHFKSKLL